VSFASWVEDKFVNPIVEGVVAGIVAEITKEADRVIDTTTDNLTGPINQLGSGLSGIVQSIIAGIKNLLPFGGLLK
jgi:hypothetical protein